MRTHLMFRISILLVCALTISGCIYWPYWWEDDGGHRGGHGSGFERGHRGDSHH